MENDPDWAAAGAARARSRATTQRAGLMSLAPEGHRQDLPLSQTVRLEVAAGSLAPRGERRLARPHHRVPRVALVGGVALHGPDDVERGIGAARELRVHVRPRGLPTLGERHQT